MPKRKHTKRDSRPHKRAKKDDGKYKWILHKLMRKMSTSSSEKKQKTDTLSLPMLTLKLSTLLALTSAQRVQTLTKINLTNIKIDADGRVDIYISDILKTSAPHKHQPWLSFPFFGARPELLKQSCSIIIKVVRLGILTSLNGTNKTSISLTRLLLNHYQMNTKTMERYRLGVKSQC
ncbi:hypothetical protein NQ315_012225 [Exocentrus adspersus]|uniref:Uncharacterized protein n=1 Tax=Exocentrus adspersus TaxID=1586481 RepID=A0AAV8VAT7_9CUCU|nr:hypothetical protein NQ315_012225 [Exocentrus adspersus]